MTETLDYSSYTRSREDGGAELDLAVEGVDCAGCIAEIEAAWQFPGVVERG